MADSVGLPAFPPFDCTESVHNMAQRWAKWSEKLETMMTAMNIKNSKRKRAMLKHYMGDEMLDIFATLPDTGDTYNSALEALNTYFKTQHNRNYEVFQFRKLEQQKDETLDQFVTKLKSLALTCGFTNPEDEVRDQIILAGRSNKLRRYAIQQPDINLDAILKHGRALEATERHATALEERGRETVNLTNSRQAEKTKQCQQKDRKQYKHKYIPENPKMCKFCGNNWHEEGLKMCKAQGRTCNKCHKPNHFAKMCFSKIDHKQGRESTSNTNYTKRQKHTTNINYTRESDSDSSDGFVLSVADTSSTRTSDKHEMVTIQFKNIILDLIVDSGATINLLNYKDYLKVKDQSKLNKPTSKTYAYGSKYPMDIIGTITLKTMYRNKEHLLTFHVTQEDGPSLLGKKSSVDIGIIRFVTLVQHDAQRISHILDKHQKLFQGIGKLKQVKVKLNVDPTITPTVQKLRRIPYHLRDKVEQELRELLTEDIIEKVPSNTPTSWVSPIVPVPKKLEPNKVRLCIDMKKANTAILRERHVTPTVADIMYELNGARHFTKLDLNKGYHQLELDSLSRHITTFVTHTGLYRYKRLHFGVNTAAEIFQQEISKLLIGIPNSLNVSDDILVFGKTQHEHDVALEQTLTKLEEAGITLNLKKCRFDKEKLKFLGSVFTKSGVTPDPDKISAIALMKEPSNPTEVRSLLGTINFCAKHIQHLALTAKPLRLLTKHNQPWQWGKEQSEAFEKLKNLITEATSLSYFDKNKSTEIWTDAGPIGLGAILVQREKDGKARVLAFASHALTDIEQRYSQIEKEALALIWATKHFHLYIYGKSFKIITDHKPLLYLYNNSDMTLSSRLERWRIKLMPYDYTIDYHPGKSNPADYLSRHPVEKKSVKETSLSRLANQYVKFITTETIPKTLTIQEIQQHTLEDPLLMKIIHSLTEDKWDLNNLNEKQASQIRAFNKIRQELATSPEQNVLLRGARLVVPQSLQHRVVKIAHAGHMGITKTKALLKEKVWFPGIDSMVEKEIQGCISCCATTNQRNTHIPNLNSSPNGPWRHLHIDHKGPIASGEYLLVIVDRYSKFPIVETVQSTGAKENIRRLDSIFATFGIPENITTDNGTPFNSRQFKEFMGRLGINHHRVIPRWPQANGQVERFNRLINKIIQIAAGNNQDWNQQMQAMLRNYRESPQQTTGRPPADLMFAYKMNTQIPCATQLKHPVDVEAVKTHTDIMKGKSLKRYAEMKTPSQTKPQVGDTVIVKQEQNRKSMSPYDMTPYTVKNVKGPMVTANRKNHTITRHETHYKIIPKMSTKDQDVSNEQDSPKQIISSNDFKDTNNHSNNNHSEDRNTNSGYNLGRQRKPTKRFIEQI